MRVRVGRLLGATALYLLIGLGMSGCSGQQQDEEGLEVSEQDNQQAADEQSAENQQATEDNEQVADNQEATNQEMNQEGEDVAENGANGGNETENDLQEIIQEMNGQQTADAGGEADAAALQQDAAAMPAQQAAPMDATAAAPAADPAAAAPSSSALPFQPGGSPAAPGLPEVGSKMAYIVQSGDTLGKISQKVYGTPGRWQEMATLSGMQNPSRIYPGDVVYYTLDESAVSFATTYESIQRSEETVQAGDTLATIAQRVYGSSKAWRSIWRQNPGVDNPDVVTPGSTVYYISQGALSAALEKTRNNVIKLAKADGKKAEKIVKTFKGKNSPSQGSMLI